MPTGVVTRWYSDKGFGFVKPDDSGEDLFFHVSCLLDGDGSVRDGDEIRYKVDFDDRKGKDRAIDVELKDGKKKRSRSRRSRSPPRRSRSPPPRRGGGGSAGGGGGGGGAERRPGDWDCPSCGFLCFASKDVCPKCGTPKDGDRGSGRGGGRQSSRDRDSGGGRDRDRDRGSDRRDDRRGGGRDRSNDRGDRGRDSDRGDRAGGRDAKRGRSYSR